MTLNLIGVARARGGSSFDPASPPPIGNVTPNTGRFTSVGVGIAAPATGVYIFDTAPVSLRIDVQSDTASAEPQVLWTRTRASNTAVVASDSLGAFNWRGRSPSATNAGAATIRALVDGSPSGGAVPGKLEFLTGGGVSSTPTLRMTIAASGLVTVAGAFQAAALDATPIGGTTPAAGAFTTGRFNGDLTLAGAPGKIKPAADSATALQLANAAGTAVLTLRTLSPELLSMTGRLNVTGNTDNIQVQFKANATQNADIWQVLDSSNNVQFSIDGVNRFNIYSTNNNTPFFVAPLGSTRPGDTMAAIFSKAADKTVLVLRGFSGQSANLLEAQSSTPGTLTTISASGALTVLSDTDATTILGRARIDSRTTDRAVFSHFDQTGGGAFALAQLADGTTLLNAPTGFVVSIRNNSTEIMSVGAAGLIDTVADAATNTVTNVETYIHTSSGVPAASFGVGNLFRGHSSTNTIRDMARIRSTWTTPTDATRKARGIASAFDTAERDCIMWEASGTAPMVGFLGTSPIVKPALGAWAGLTDTQKLDALRDALNNLGLASYT